VVINVNDKNVLTVVTGPPNGPVLFCSLLSVGVVCNAAGRQAADTAWRASMVTSR